MGNKTSMRVALVGLAGMILSAPNLASADILGLDMVYLTFNRVDHVADNSLYGVSISGVLSNALQWHNCSSSGGCSGGGSAQSSPPTWLPVSLGSPFQVQLFANPYAAPPFYTQYLDGCRTAGLLVQSNPSKYVLTVGVGYNASYVTPIPSSSVTNIFGYLDVFTVANGSFDNTPSDWFNVIKSFDGAGNPIPTLVVTGPYLPVSGSAPVALPASCDTGLVSSMGAPVAPGTIF